MAVAASAAYWIERLQLTPYPEGGYFRETYRSPELVAPDALPARFPGARAFSTAIYFLLPSNEVSRLHRLRSDELWHFYAGGAWFGARVRDPGSFTLAGCTVAPGFDD